MHRPTAASRAPSRRRWLGFTAAAALLAGAAIAAEGCWLAGSTRPVSCIWIVVDTLRADHLEWYGYGRPTAPELRPLVERGVLFEHAYTSLPETTPAMSSMLTSMYPYRHGVQHLFQRLNDRNVTAPELLKKAGYATGAFVSSFVMIRNFSNFARGFDVYDDFVDEREKYRDNYERKAARTLDRARTWIEAHRAAPFFCFIHLIDPHGPYTPPGKFALRFHSATTEPIAKSLIPSYQQMPGVTDANRYRDLYDGEIAYASSELGRFFAYLESADLLAPNLVVFAADHGEAMGEHGFYFQHGSDIYEQEVHVPLIVKPPAGMRAARGTRVAQTVSVVDILPTVLETLGLPSLAVFQGRSLVPLLVGDAGDAGGVFARRPVFFELNGHIRQVGEVRAGRKLLLAGDQLAEYDLGRDPAERIPLPPERRDLAAESELKAWKTMSELWHRDFVVETNGMAEALRGAFVHGRRDPDESARHLRSLGYL
ncbi:MAG TPA: sulfatase [Thermoanaerobaculia bacterium]|nr:sulfatase [Thermoanaerobaculia bacterium]